MRNDNIETFQSASQRDEELCTILIARVRDYALEITIHGPLPSGMRDAATLGNGDFGVVFAGVRERLRQLGGTLKITTGGAKSMIGASLPLER